MAGEVVVERAVYREVGVRNGPLLDPIKLRTGAYGRGWLPRTAQCMANDVQRSTSREAADAAGQTTRFPYCRASFERVAHDVGEHWLQEHADIEDDLTQKLEVPAEATFANGASESLSDLVLREGEYTTLRLPATQCSSINVTVDPTTPSYGPEQFGDRDACRLLTETERRQVAAGSIGDQFRVPPGRYWVSVLSFYEGSATDVWMSDETIDMTRSGSMSIQVGRPVVDIEWSGPAESSLVAVGVATGSRVGAHRVGDDHWRMSSPLYGEEIRFVADNVVLAQIPWRNATHLDDKYVIEGR